MRIFISLIPFLPVNWNRFITNIIQSNRTVCSFRFKAQNSLLLFRNANDDKITPNQFTWMTFLVSSNCRLDLTTGSTCLDRSSRRVIWLSNARYLLSKSSQCCATVDNASRRFSKLFSKSVHCLLVSVFCCSIFDLLTGSAWRKISRAFSFSKSSSPWCD